MKKRTLLAIIFGAIFLFLRLYRIEERMNFSMDQGMFMQRAYEIWKNKELTLIGPTASPVINGRHFFQGPITYYCLVLMGLLGNWDPVKISILMVLLGLLGLLAMYKTTGWMGALIYCFLPIDIKYSNFIWNPNFLLIVMPVLMWAISNKKWILAGISAGVGLQFHFQFGLIIILILSYLLVKKGGVIKFLMGLVLGYSPLLVFDLRNNFYNLRTIGEWFFYGEKFRGGFVYYWLSFIPPLIFITVKFCKRVILYGFLIGLVIWSIIAVLTENRSNLMPNNWTYIDLVKTKMMIDGTAKKFNVVSLLDGDTKFWPLRYLLRDNSNLSNENDYSKVDELWVVASNNSKVENYPVFEIQSFGKVIDYKKIKINDEIELWQLSKFPMVNKKVATIVNPVRSRELWRDKSIIPINDQYQIINRNGLKATWLLQDDVLDDKQLVEVIKKFDDKQEIGLFLEVSKNLAYKSRVYFEEQKPWYDPSVVFLSGYEPEERKKIIDKMFLNFKKVFGYYPMSVGAWWIDSYSLKYMEKKYGIKAVMICADQKTTDSYGIWGQWWGYPYHPSANNILVPGNSRTVVIQWALRDPVEAFGGTGWQTSNHSLQANDYVSLGLNTKYFEKIANIYFDPRNKLGQITVGLETGIESVPYIGEFSNQMEWIAKNKIETLKMSEISEIYKKNPSEVWIGEWKMTDKYRENKILGERIDYKTNYVFKDYFEKDSDSFLNRVYAKENLQEIPPIKKETVFIFIFFIIGIAIGAKWPKIYWSIILLGILWLMEHVRYSVVGGEKILGFLVDNFWLMGIGEKIRFINEDLTNNVAKSMLKIDFKYFDWGYWVVFGLLLGNIWKKLQDKVKLKK